jgi:solute carrier family 35, member E3
VTTNKYLFDEDGFTFHLELLLYHITMTLIYAMTLDRCLQRSSSSGGASSSSSSSSSNQVPWPWWRQVIDAGVTNVSLVCMNALLQGGGVAVYQLGKLAMIPLQALIQYLLFNKQIRPLTTLSLLLLLMGVAMTLSLDFSHLRTSDWLLGAAAVVFTTASQTLVQHSQNAVKVDKIVYLREISLWQVCLLLPAMAALHLHARLTLQPTVLDFLGSLQTADDVVRVVGLFFFSGLLAFLVNMCSFFVIGSLSALTYQILGHAKTTAVLTMGYLLFDTLPSSGGVIGLAISCVGIALYTIDQTAPNKCATANKSCLPF